MELFIDYIIPFLALLISVLNSSFYLFSYRVELKQRKFDLEHKLLIDIRDARSKFLDICDKLTSIPKNKTELTSVVAAMVEERKEEYLNTIDYTCDKYLNGFLDKKSFINNLSPLVLTISSSKTLRNSVFNEKKNIYPNIKRVVLELEK